MLKGEKVKQRISSLDLTLYTILFLFFIQLLTEFIESLYAIGLLGATVPIEAAVVIILFSPLLLIFTRRGISPTILLILGELIMISRSLEVVMDTRGRMVVSGLGVGAFLIFFPAFLACLRREPANQESLHLGVGLSLAAMLSIFFRVMNSGSDITFSTNFRLIGWGLALLGAAILVVRLSPEHLSTSIAIREWNQDGKTRRLTTYAVGITGVFTLLYFAFCSPNVIARWTNENYLLIVAVLTGGWGLFVLALCLKPDWITSISPWNLLAGNFLFILGMCLTILLHQVRFPSDLNAYPLAVDDPGAWATIPMVIMLLFSPVLGLDFLFFIRGILRERPPLRSMSFAFSIGALILVLMILGHIFTTIYDYVPVIGPLLRNRFWVVYLAAAGLVIYGLQNITNLLKSQPDFLLPTRSLPAISLVCLIWIGSVLQAGLRHVDPVVLPGVQNLRVLTYNIQQGYDQNGQFSYDGQLRFIRQVNPDVIGIQESDTNRIANGNSDVVRYFADKLSMYSYYGPNTTTGTFGIAMLSKYPIQNPQTYFLYSEGEQTAAIEADILVQDQPYHILITHLGNDGPLIQQENVLKILEGDENIIAMGDFNFTPDTQQYHLTTKILQDAWLLAGENGTANPGFDSQERIDYIFVSPGIKLAGSQYFLTSESDHPALIADISW